MHLALLHDGRPALLRVEGRVGAPAALFFHPFPLHADAWEEMLAACVSAGLCAAALDAPGFGGTPPLGHATTMDHLAGLGAAALDALGAAKAAIVGCSMGGYAAMAFARRFPQRMKSAVLIATKAIAEFAPKLLAPQAPQSIRDRVEALAARATAQGIADTLRGMAQRPDSTPDLPGWSVPCLVIAGEQDQLMPRAEMEKIAAGVRGATLEVIRGAGHLPFLENPAAVAPLLVAHIRKSV